MVEETLVLLKPDALEKGLVDTCISELESHGLSVLARRSVQFTSELLEQHYAHIVDLPVFPQVQKYMMRSPCLALRVRGESAVTVVRQIAGATVPTKAAPESLRGRFGVVKPDGSIENVLHASAPGDAEIEIRRFFG